MTYIFYLTTSIPLSNTRCPGLFLRSPWSENFQIQTRFTLIYLSRIFSKFAKQILKLDP